MFQEREHEEMVSNTAALAEPLRPSEMMMIKEKNETDTQSASITSKLSNCDPPPPYYYGYGMSQNYPNSVFVPPPPHNYPCHSHEIMEQMRASSMGHYPKDYQYWLPGPQEQQQHAVYGCESYTIPVLVFPAAPQGQPYSYPTLNAYGLNELRQPIDMVRGNTSPITSRTTLCHNLSSPRALEREVSSDEIDTVSSESGESGGSGGRPDHWRGWNRRMIEGPPGANLFIYHLPSEVTDAHLMTWFSPLGKVLSVRVFVNRDTNISKGFGFVSYATPEMAQVAIMAMDKACIGNKRLKVKLKERKET